MKISESKEEPFYKDKEFCFESLLTKFQKMSEEEKRKFGKELKEGYNTVMGIIFEEVKRVYYEYLAAKAQNMQEINAFRAGLQMFIAFEKMIKKYIENYELQAKNLGKENLLKNL